MKIWEWNEKEYFLIILSEEQAYAKIKEYYKNEGFKGEVRFRKYIYSVPDGFGFTDEYGSMKIQFIDKIKILNQEKERVKEVSVNDIDFNDIFSPLFEDTPYEISLDGIYKPYFKFRIIDPNNKTVRCEGLNLYVTKKIKEKVLKKD